MSNDKVIEMKLDERVVNYKQSLKEKTLYVLKEVIPKKIVEFQKLSEVKIDDISNNTDGVESSLKKRKFVETISNNVTLEELINVNTKILEHHKQLKQHYVDLIETFSVVRAWISLNIPKIEDGNNFGVDIQEEVLGQVSKLEDLYSHQLDHSENYCLGRADMVKKALKHKEIDAYKYAIIQLDDKEMIRTHFAYFDLANNYAATYSLVIKNFQKLDAPRNSHASSLF